MSALKADAKFELTYHFIGEDAIDARLVETDEPVQAIKLVISKLTSDKD